MKQSYKIGFIFIAVFSLFVLPISNVFAGGTPTLDFTSSPADLTHMLGTFSPSFTNKNFNSYNTVMYGPLHISTDITGVNSVTMKFRETGLPGQPYVCPNADLSQGDTGWAAMWNHFTLYNEDTATTTWSQVVTDLSLNGGPTKNLQGDASIVYQNDWTTWQQNPDGSCTSIINQILPGPGGSITQVNAGWYVLWFPDAWNDAHNTTAWNNSLAINASNYSQISILGDNTYDLSIHALTAGVNTWVMDTNFFSGEFPLTPSYPYITFTQMTLPDISTNTCDQFIFPANYICAALQFLFIPSNASLQQFGNIKTKIENKPPFGYISLINSDLQGVNDTASSTITLESLPILNTYIFDPIRTGLIWVFWFGFAFILFHRLKNIDL